MVEELAADHGTQFSESRFTIVPTFHSSMSRSTEMYVLISTSYPTRRAMVIICAFDDPPMYLQEQNFVQGPIFRLFGDPTIRTDHCPGLTLRSCLKLTGGFARKCFVQFLLGEISSLDTRGSSHLALQLNRLKMFCPLTLVRNLRQRQDSGFGFDQRLEDFALSIDQPTPWSLVAYHGIKDSSASVEVKSQLVSNEIVLFHNTGATLLRFVTTSVSDLSRVPMTHRSLPVVWIHSELLQLGPGLVAVETPAVVD